MAKIITSDNPKMDRIPDKVLDAIETLVKVSSNSFAIDTVDYETGTILISNTYNQGTDSEWTEHDFITVNVNADSMNAIRKDIFKAVDKY
jgi:hypothetical protein